MVCLYRCLVPTDAIPVDLRLLGCIPGTLTSDASIIKGGEVSVIPAGIVQTPAADSPDSVAAKV